MTREQQENGTTEASTPEGEAEPINDGPEGRLGPLDGELEAHPFPATGSELIDALGGCEIETQEGTKSLEEVLSTIDDQRYDSADDARSRILGLIRR